MKPPAVSAMTGVLIAATVFTLVATGFIWSMEAVKERDLASVHQAAVQARQDSDDRSTQEAFDRIEEDEREVRRVKACLGYRDLHLAAPHTLHCDDPPPGVTLNPGVTQ